jgi:hypothetical protein
MTVSAEDKVREARLRRVAERRGLRLVRSRRRDPGALTYGRYFIQAQDGQVPSGYQAVRGLTLDEVEERLAIAGMPGEIERRGEYAPESPFPAESAGGGRPRDHGYSYSANRTPGEIAPEWVMVGVDVPAGKRLYASRELKGSAFAVAAQEHSYTADGWHLTTTMRRMLVITKLTYVECLAELMRIWQNWENEGRELPAAPARNGKALM